MATRNDRQAIKFLAAGKVVAIIGYDF